MCVCISWTNKLFDIINIHGATMEILDQYTTIKHRIDYSIALNNQVR